MAVLEMNYCPRCGHALENRFAFGRTRRVCPGCDFIFFRDKKVAASVLIVQGGKVLLVRRAMMPRKGLWTNPAGFVEYDEDPRDAAVREVLEETGYQVEVIELLDAIHGREHERGADLVIAYRARIVGGAPRPADDVDDLRFFGPDELPRLAFRATRQVVDFWLSELSCTQDRVVTG